MPFPLLLLAAGAAGLGLLATRRQLPPDQRPFAAFPETVGDVPIGSEIVTASSQRRYRVTSFPSADAHVYHVAELQGSLDWLSYLQAPGSSERMFWGASATAEALDSMRRDFDVTMPEVAA